MFDIVTIGTATIDVFLKSRNFKVLKDPHFTAQAGFPEHEAQCFALGSKLEVEELCMATGGGATNSAVTFARQGLKTATVCRLGKDENAEIIKKDLKKEKVETFLIHDPAHQTAYSTILISEDGERTIMVYRGASASLKFDELPLSKIDARWAYITPGSMKLESLQKLFKCFTDKKTKIAFNPSRAQLELGIEKLGQILHAVDVFIVNREEGSYLTGQPFEKEREIFKVLDKAVEGIVVMTEGPKGVMVSDGKMLYRAGTFKEKKLVDRSGSGDAFGSGFVAALVKGGKIEDGIRFGSANATSVVEYIGAKKGILTEGGLKRDARWRNLEISKKSIYN